MSTNNDTNNLARLESTTVDFSSSQSIGSPSKSPPTKVAKYSPMPNPYSPATKRPVQRLPVTGRGFQGRGGGRGRGRGPNTSTASKVQSSLQEAFKSSSQKATLTPTKSLGNALDMFNACKKQATKKPTTIVFPAFDRVAIGRHMNNGNPIKGSENSINPQILLVAPYFNIVNVKDPDVLATLLKFLRVLEKIDPSIMLVHLINDKYNPEHDILVKNLTLDNFGDYVHGVAPKDKYLELQCHIRSTVPSLPQYVNIWLKPSNHKAKIVKYLHLPVVNVCWYAFATATNVNPIAFSKYLNDDVVQGYTVNAVPSTVFLRKTDNSVISAFGLTIEAHEREAKHISNLLFGMKKLLGAHYKNLVAVPMKMFFNYYEAKRMFYRHRGFLMNHVPLYLHTNDTMNYWPFIEKILLEKVEKGGAILVFTAEFYETQALSYLVVTCLSKNLIQTAKMLGVYVLQFGHNYTLLDKKDTEMKNIKFEESKFTILVIGSRLPFKATKMRQIDTTKPPSPDSASVLTAFASAASQTSTTATVPTTPAKQTTAPKKLTSNQARKKLSKTKTVASTPTKIPLAPDSVIPMGPPPRVPVVVTNLEKEMKDRFTEMDSRENSRLTTLQQLETKTKVSIDEMKQHSAKVEELSTTITEEFQRLSNSVTNSFNINMDKIEESLSTLETKFENKNCALLQEQLKEHTDTLTSLLSNLF